MTCFILFASVSLTLAQTVEGELRRWHKVTLTFDGPNVSETANPNPFADYRMTVTFTHSGSGRSYAVPGYYAACGDAAETSCTSGNQWRVHFAPDRPGTWNWRAELMAGNDVAINGGGTSAGFFDGQSGSLSIQESNKSGDDLRAPNKGRIQYVNQHYLRHSGITPDQPSGEWFLKAGADAPENMLSYNDFDAIPNPKKTWQPHQQDYRSAEASGYTWQGGKGSEMLGVVRYLTEIKGVNAMSFLTFSLDGESSANGSYLLRSTDKTAYLLYLPNGGSTNISGLPSGTHALRWFNPRNGNLGNTQSFTGNSLSAPNGDDWVAFIVTNGSTPPPPPPTGMVLEEVNGVLAIEAEHFVSQSQTQHREWYLTEPGNTPNVTPDPDGNHASSASGNAYLEILPDTRVTHNDPLVQGVSFSNTPGQITVIDYQVYVNNPGRYYVWVRAYSTGTEDNGVHVGLDGNWPSSGARMQWCQGKNQWTWESKQRTNANHCGEPQLIYLDINALTPGLYIISVRGSNWVKSERILVEE